MSLNERIDVYLLNVKKSNDLKKEQTLLRKFLKEEELYFKEYLEKNNMTSISSSNGEIFLHDKKSNNPLNKEDIKTLLNEKISNSSIVEEIQTSIFNNTKIETIIKTKKLN